MGGMEEWAEQGGSVDKRIFGMWLILPRETCSVVLRTFYNALCTYASIQSWD